ncbi:MAG: hypothetical protein WCA77_08100, partial [Thermoplasmata archaeon]
LPGRRHRWPCGAWSPENPSLETGRDLSELTDEIKAASNANRSIQQEQRPPVSEESVTTSNTPHTR